MNLSSILFENVSSISDLLILINANNLSIFDLLILINLIFIMGILFISNYYDLKYNIVPNYLVKILLASGLLINISLAMLFKSFYFLLFSFVLAFLVFIFSFLLWMLKFWAGGDVKLFTALSFSLSFLSKDFILNHFANSHMLDCYGASYIVNNLTIFHQFTLYPKIFSILLNGLLLYLPLIISIIIIRFFKNSKTDLGFKNNLQTPYLANFFILIIFNFSNIIKLSTSSLIDIRDLKEGMLLDKYYFDDENVFIKINDLDGDYNLVCHKEAGRFNNSSQGYYLESGTAAGLTLDDLDFLKGLYDQGLIKSSKFNIKLTIPFLPSLTLGFIVMLVWGDLISIISSFI